MLEKPHPQVQSSGIWRYLHAYDISGKMLLRIAKGCCTQNWCTKVVMMRMGNCVCCGTEWPSGLEAGPTKALGCTVQHLHLTLNITLIFTTRFCLVSKWQRSETGRDSHVEVSKAPTCSVILFTAEKLSDVDLSLYACTSR